MNSSAAKKPPGYVGEVFQPLFGRKNLGFVFRFELAPIFFPYLSTQFVLVSWNSILYSFGWGGAHLIQSSELPYVGFSSVIENQPQKRRAKHAVATNFCGWICDPNVSHVTKRHALIFFSRGGSLLMSSFLYTTLHVLWCPYGSDKLNECDRYDTYYSRTRVKENKRTGQAERTTTKEEAILSRNWGENSNRMSGITLPYFSEICTPCFYTVPKFDVHLVTASSAHTLLHVNLSRQSYFSLQVNHSRTWHVSRISSSKRCASRNSWHRREQSRSFLQTTSLLWQSCCPWHSSLHTESADAQR